MLGSWVICGVLVFVFVNSLLPTPVKLVFNYLHYFETYLIEARAVCFKWTWFILSSCIEQLLELERRHDTEPFSNRQRNLLYLPIIWTSNVGLLISGVHYAWRTESKTKQISKFQPFVFCSRDLIAPARSHELVLVMFHIINRTYRNFNRTANGRLVLGWLLQTKCSFYCCHFLFAEDSKCQNVQMRSSTVVFAAKNSLV